MPDPDTPEFWIDVIRNAARIVIHGPHTNPKRVFGVDQDNYLGIGYLFVDKIRRNFDPTRGVPLHKYAIHVLVMEIRRISWSEANPVHIPLYLGEGGRKRKAVHQSKARRWLEGRVGLSDASRLPERPGDDEGEWGEDLELVFALAKSRLLWRLAPRQTHIIARHLGLDGRPPQTFEELAIELETAGKPLTRQRIHQLYSEAIQKLSVWSLEERWPGGYESKTP